jgi:lipopolysaccharide biosynthesis glycosyltransferase
MEILDESNICFETNKENKTINLRILNNDKLVFYIKPKYNINIKMNNVIYKLDINCEWFLLLDSKEVSIFRNYDLDITEEDFEFKIYKYSQPKFNLDGKYEFFYCFDKNYIQGAFASIYSLLSNLDSSVIANLNLIIPIGDLDIFFKSYQELLENNNFKFNYKLRIYLLNNTIVPEYILNTKCFKGGNHLLKLSNFSRLIIGNLINCDKVMYLDSDTIIQSDLSKKLDQIEDLNFVIMGKKSDLNYKNILNCNNLDHAKKYLGENFDFSKNVIYTGSLVINPNNFRKYDKKMEELIILHNSISNKGGLYKLFTMSIINLALSDSIKYFDEYINNVVDLGHKKFLDTNADILDWSGIYKPWYLNGLYTDLWQKYNLIYVINDFVTTNKNTIESF